MTKQGTLAIFGYIEIFELAFIFSSIPSDSKVGDLVA